MSITNDSGAITMEQFENIRALYLPVQPTVRQSGENVTYREVAPNESLRNMIYCYWELKTKVALEEQFKYSVVSDGCIDIFLELKSPHESYVMGFCKKFTEFPLKTSFHYIGIRFLPTMFPQIFNVDAALLSNRFELLKAVDYKTSSFLSDNVTGKMALDNIKSIFDDYFTDTISKINFNTDSRLYKSLAIILKNKGVVNLNEQLDFGISQRQLRRLFRFYIGDTAKTFCKVVRFQHILRAKPSTQSLRKSKLFFDVGYYDQAHFIKEFKNHYGVTPSRAFGR